MIEQVGRSEGIWGTDRARSYCESSEILGLGELGMWWEEGTERQTEHHRTGVVIVVINQKATGATIQVYI